MGWTPGNRGAFWKPVGNDLAACLPLAWGFTQPAMQRRIASTGIPSTGISRGCSGWKEPGEVSKILAWPHFCRAVLVFLAEELARAPLLPLSRVFKRSLSQLDNSQLPGDPLMSILLLFGKGKADALSLTEGCWKAPQLTQVPFSAEQAVENLLVYMKNKHHYLDSAEGGREELGVGCLPAPVPLWERRILAERATHLEKESQQITERSHLCWKHTAGSSHTVFTLLWKVRLCSPGGPRSILKPWLIHKRDHKTNVMLSFLAGVHAETLGTTVPAPRGRKDTSKG